MIYHKFAKRFLDITFALLAFPLLIIATIILAPLIWIDDPGPVFYCGDRRGYKGKIFPMIKFRTMFCNAPDMRNVDNSAFSSNNDPRVTRIGRYLRTSSVDEIPQILNIIKGDMSWVGPRAKLPRAGVTWDDLSADKRKRFSVRPGITGYAASLFRNAIDSEEKLYYDNYYVDNISLVLDMKIIIWTIRSVIGRKNLYTNTSITDRKNGEN